MDNTSVTNKDSSVPTLLFDPKKDNDIFNISKAKNMQIKYRKFFERRDLDNVGIVLWLKSYLNYYDEVDTYTLHSLPIDRAMEKHPMLTVLSAICFSPKLLTEERLMVTQFMMNQIKDMGKLIPSSCISTYHNDLKYAVLMLSPHITFSERLDYGVQMLDQYPKILSRIFMETPLTLAEACSFLDHIEDITASSIQTGIKKVSENSNPADFIASISLHDFIKMNTSLNAFEKVYLISNYIQKEVYTFSEVNTQLQIKQYARDLFFSSTMALNEILRYSYWIPFFGAQEYFNILMQASQRSGTSVSRNRKAVYEFRNKYYITLGDVSNTEVKKLFADFYSGRVNYLNG